VANEFGLTSANTLASGGRDLGAEGQNLTSQVNNLLAAMERDKDVVQGNALAAFRQAQSEFNTAFGSLVKWCQDHGVKLGEAQTHANTTDTNSQADFHTAGNTFGALPRMNRA
jgi:uncharacterized protein YukE